MLTNYFGDTGYDVCLFLEFRLAGGMRPNEGYLEVNGNISWLGARSESWSVENSRVICRMLGFSEAVVNVSGNASFVQPNASFTELQAHCRGNETSVQKCVGWKLTGGGTTYPVLPIWLLCQTNGMEIYIRNSVYSWSYGTYKENLM